MLYIGPISSLYDFLTFYVLLHYFHAGEAEFHTGWFVESLATQTLVLFVIRTMGNPLKSRPSISAGDHYDTRRDHRHLAALFAARSRTGIHAAAAPFFAFLAISTVTYLALVEVAKRRLFARAEI